ncbi:N-acetylmuramoyl-L-alanine amidase [Salibacterium salarium]|uniref:N-acetylmuramoyl-L-alanine amidase n=1 Tax=Salibacterium salarium TaxID=284579 RepID=UPI00277F1645|nr:N-acetylmuramoyl-L-alanine amidase [Salibacterium salarium]MDQ0300312.1 N-acetylmuramoyl-L-alanine amidase [Salibacterium salarium]
MAYIVLDPGHGGSDPGAVYQDTKEKELTLLIARKVSEHFKVDKKHSVKMTRNNDNYLSLEERVKIANDWGADYFVSLHHNAGGGHGFESYVYSGNKNTETKEKQEIVHRSIMSFLQSYELPDRGMKENNYFVLKNTKMSAILLENLFLDHDKDVALLSKNEFITNLSTSIYEGVELSLN